ncbi:MAG: tetratricopeptide repeat protein [Proteobacteria bacterium]|nr:tetratricopeptide repeat protein [Pseudomonadota bacterium]
MKKVILFFSLLLIASCNNEKDPIALVSSAKRLSDKSQFSEAKVLLLEAINIDNKYPDAYIELGRVYEGMDNNELAEKTYFKVLEVRPDHVYANLYISNLYRKTGKMKLAIDYLKKATELSKNEAWMYQLLGKLYLDTEQPQLAKASLDKAVSIDPNDHTYRNDLAKACVIVKDKDCALTNYKKVVELLDGMPKHNQEVLEALDKIKNLEASNSPN